MRRSRADVDGHDCKIGVLIVYISRRASQDKPAMPSYPEPDFYPCTINSIRKCQYFIILDRKSVV